MFLGIVLLPAPAGAEQEGDFTFESDGSTAAVTGYTGAGGGVTIPPTLGGRPVRGIGNYAFLGKSSITSLSLPSSLVSIGTESFGGCAGLASVTIPESVTYLGDYAFSGCNGLTSVTVPASVTAIGPGPFAHCSALQTINVAAANPAFRSVNGIWFDTSQTTLVQYPAGRTGSYVVPGGVTAIRAGAFAGNPGLSGVTIPGNVTTIGSGAFWSCQGLTGVSLANGLVTIEEGAFGVCGNLSAVTIPASVASIGTFAFGDCVSLSSLTIQPGVAAIGDAAFWSCGLSSVTIPASVTSIGNGPFAQCAAMTGITVNGENPAFRDQAGVLFDKAMSSLVQYPIGRSGPFVVPSGIVSIRDRAFSGCAGLTGVVVPSSTTSIGYQALARCPGLTSVSIPAGVAAIGDEAFNSCTNLSVATFAGSAPASFGDRVFDNTHPNFTVHFYHGAPGFTAPVWENYPASPLFTSNGDFISSNDGTAVTITGYSGAGGAVAIPPFIGGLPVRAIGNDAFWGNVAVTSVSIPNSVTAIGNDAFRECPNLVAVTIGSGLISMGDRAFRECRSLTSVIISEGVTSIGSYAFESCSALASVVFPASLTQIGAGPFAFCTDLLTIEVAAGNPYFSSIDGVLFDANVSQLIQYPPGRWGGYVIPDSVLFIGSSAFSSCATLTSVDIPESVVSIGYYAFQFCSGLTELSIPGSVRFIGWLAFQECTGLVSVVFEGDAPDYIEPNAFERVPPDFSGFSIYFHAGARGFTSPFWMGYPAALSEAEIDLAEALDEPGRVLSSGGADLWIGQTGVTRDGTDAASAGAVGHGQESWLETAVTGPGVLRFWWKVSSEEGFDWLEFQVDGVLRDRISGEAGWVERIYPLAAGANVLRFRYTKDGSVVRGADTGWVDSFQWSPGEIEPGAADFTYSFSDSEVTIVRYTGPGGSVVVPSQIAGMPVRYIARNAFLGHAALTSVTLPDSIFAIGESAFEGCRALADVVMGSGVYLIGNGAFRSCESLIGVIIGEGVLWIGNEAFAYTALRGIVIPDSVEAIGSGAFFNCPGLTTVTFGQALTEIADYAFSQCVSLTQLLFAGDAPPPWGMGTGVFVGLSPARITLYYYEGSTGFGDSYWWNFPKGNRGHADGGLEDAVEQQTLIFTTGGGNGLWRSASDGAQGDTDSAASGEITHNQESWMETTVTGPGTLSFWWKVSSEGGYDWLEFRTDGQLKNRIAGESDWQLQSHFLGSGSHTLRWRYTKDASVHRGDDEGRVDQVVWSKFLTPVAATGGHDVETTARIKVKGLVDAKGSAADVSFEYREKGTLAKSAAAGVMPSRVEGDGLQPVSAIIDGLDQGKTYEYRALARLAADPTVYGEGQWQDVSLGVLSDLRQVTPPTSTQSNASLTVHLQPAGIGAWRIAGEYGWRLSGETVVALLRGPRTVEFQALSGYTEPKVQLLDLPAGADIERSFAYDETPGGGEGSLQVILARRDGVATYSELRWRLTVDPENRWRDSGEVLPLPAGSYRIQCRPFGFPLAEPSDTTVSVGRGKEVTVKLHYGSTAHLLTPADFPVSGNPMPPQVHVGQISTRVGTSTGFAVGPYAVATAAHVVFEDETLSYIPTIHWLHQRHAGMREPLVRTARGSCVLSGYAMLRREERKASGGASGTSSPESYDRDAAALYFTGEVADGGFSGFLASEAGDGNEFLSGHAEKFLTGYPAEGIPAGNLGRLHQSPVVTVSLDPGFRETWTSPAPAGRPGCSGGPLFVRHQNGRSYPAALYLGESSGKSVFRSIDRELAELFDRAGKYGNQGGQGTGGGAEYASRFSGDDDATGRVTVVVTPSEAGSQASWSLYDHDGKVIHQGRAGETTPELPAGFYALEMDPLDGYLDPPVSALEVKARENLTFRQTYSLDLLSELATWRTTHFGSPANLGRGSDSADPDGDGARNIEEYEAGTDPEDAADVFKVRSFERGSSGFTVHFPAKAGYQYILERSTAPGGDTWENVAATATLPADVPLLSLTGSLPPGGRAFYRVKVVKP